jgi:Holliday junction resolvase
MPNPSKKRGSAWERAIVEHLRTVGWPYAERRIAGSAKDRGDIAGVVGVVICSLDTEQEDCNE